MQALGYFNDRFIELSEQIISLEERGLQFGDGVYEVIAVYEGKAYALDEHIDRLFMSSKSILLDPPKSRDQFRTIVEEGIRKVGMNHGTVYIQVTRGSAPRNHVFPIDPVPNVYMTWKHGMPKLDQQRSEGVQVYTLPDERWKNCYIKSTCLLPNILAKEHVHRKGGLEAILIRDNEVKEGSSSNVFVVKDGIIKTPIADHSILNGITRQRVIQIVKRHGMSFQDTRLTMEDLKDADEIFLTGTTYEVIPVVKCDEQVIGQKEPGPYYKRIYQLFREDVEKECSFLSEPGVG